MNWSSPSDFLALLMVIYVCLGVVLCTTMVMYYIHKNSLTQHKFAFCVEMILVYGPIGLYLIWMDLKKLVKYLWTRDYKGWYKKQAKEFKKCREQAKEVRLFKKQLREARKK